MRGLFWKRILKPVLIALLVVMALVAVIVVFLTVTEYRPKDTEALDITAKVSGKEESDTSELPSVRVGTSLSILTWNIGYGALGDNADFFMDGGSSVFTADSQRVHENISGICKEIETLDPDFVFLQEADVYSDRSCHVNEVQTLRDSFTENNGESGASTFAYNFKVKFIPYPVPPIGRVESGIFTLSKYHITDSERVQLPCPFSWPVRTANLKRCLMVDRIPVVNASGENTGRELVLVNLHLEAYDSGEGKTAQTKMLRTLLQEEADKGNYVIAGGDFNQTFSGTDGSMYPEYEGRWHCGEIEESEFDNGWQFLMDNTVPTCRSLDQSYKGKSDKNFQFYMIDGFIVSSNVHVDTLQTQDLKFKNSDHNPVLLGVELR